MKEKRVWLFAVFFVLLFLFSVAEARVANAADSSASAGSYGDEFSQFYVGVTGGQTRWDLSSDLGLTATDENDAAIGGLFGYRVNKFIGFETFGNYFGEPKYLEISDVKVWDYGVGLNLYLPLGALIEGSNLDFISVFAKGGAHYWHFDANDNSGTIDYNDKGIDWCYGFGLNVDLNRYLALRAEHNVYAMDIVDSNTKVNTDALTVILKF